MEPIQIYLSKNTFPFYVNGKLWCFGEVTLRELHDGCVLQYVTPPPCHIDALPKVGIVTKQVQFKLDRKQTIFTLNDEEVYLENDYEKRYLQRICLKESK